MPIRLAIIDDHSSFREGFVAALSFEHDFDVVAQGASAKEAIGLVERTAPDVLVIDISMPEIDGLFAVRRVAAARMKTRSLVLTGHATVDFGVAAFGAGASGFASKAQNLVEIFAAIRHVAAGDRYVAPAMSPRVVEAARAGALNEGERTAVDPLGALTTREREIFHLAACGTTNDAIAATLTISVKTVETHRAHINRKLALHSPVDLVLFAATHGLLLLAKA
jgi:two-component system, NarL family, response regulator NreC